MAQAGSKPSDSISGPNVDGNNQKPKSRKVDKAGLAAKRRCVSSACIACRRRKSKCDGGIPSCAACASVYGTECIYDPNSDHRRKGVYKKDIDNLKTRNSTLQTLIQGILNYPEDEVYDLVSQIRTCENLEDVAEEILSRGVSLAQESDDNDSRSIDSRVSDGAKIEKEISAKMGELRLENGAIRFLGGTSNLLYLDSEMDIGREAAVVATDTMQREDPVMSWTSVSSDKDLIVHLLNMYFTWHYTYFTTLSKSLFFRDFFAGNFADRSLQTKHCTPLLVNAMLALGCHFTSWPTSREDPKNPSTAGDHFFKEAKRLILANDEFENPKLATVQALALMSVREAGCGREAKGWIYSGMSFRMACDLGLNLGLTGGGGSSGLNDEEIDARRITFWGCFLFDKCWSNYLGRTPQLILPNITTPKFDVFPSEDAEPWSPWTDAGSTQSNTQPSRTRAIALQISKLCEISADLLLTFYRPAQHQKPLSKSAEVKRLSEFHTRLEAWKKSIPKEMEAREGQLPNVILMHMFFHLLFIHLFRPFLKYSQTSSPLPPNVSPRKMCTQAASSISKLFRLYRKTYGLKQICNIAIYIAHSACTIHLLNLPEKGAQRDIIYGVRHLEEISNCWLGASRALATLGIQVRRWKIDLPDDTTSILQQWESQYRNEHPSLNFDKTSPTIEQAQRVASAGSVQGTFSEYEHQDALFPNLSGIQTTNNSVKKNPHATMDSSSSVSAPSSSPNSSFQRTDGLPQTLSGQSSGWGKKEPGVAAPMPSFDQPQQPRQPSYSSIFTGFDSLFEDSKDWWLRDQSAFFDSWGDARRTSSLSLTGDVPVIVPPANFPGDGVDDVFGAPGVRNGNDFGYQ